MYNPYNPYQPYQNQQAMQTMVPASMPRQELVKVNGRPGAEAYQMAANSSALLLDETAPIVWLVQTDGAGYKSLSPYSISPYQPEPPVDVKSLLQRVEKLEAMINVKESNIAGDAETGR